jgi:hypothetical protein
MLLYVRASHQCTFAHCRNVVVFVSVIAAYISCTRGRAILNPLLAYTNALAADIALL